MWPEMDCGKLWAPESQFGIPKWSNRKMVHQVSYPP